MRAVRTRLYIRPLDGEARWLAIEGSRFVEDDGFGELIDTGRFWAIPGLADCHAHLAGDTRADLGRPGRLDQVRVRAFSQLAAGVFVVLDKGWSDDVVMSLLDDPLEGRPYLRVAGRRIIATAGGYYPGFCQEVDPAELPAAVAAAASPGGWVKIIGDWPRPGRGAVANFPEEALAAAVAAAHRAGVKVAVHSFAPDVPGAAVRAGVDSVEHGLYMTPADLAVLGGYGGAWVPTIACVRSVLDSLAPGSSGATLLGAGLEQLRRVLPMAGAAGATVLAGTDLALPHGGVAEEARLLSEWGLGDEAAFQAVTSNAYRYLEIEHSFVPGALADVVFVEADPRSDITTLGHPAAVVRAGRVLRGPL